MAEHDFEGLALPEGARVIWAPAHPSNYSKGPLWFGKFKRLYIGQVIHTPEEEADDNEVTPRWFQDPRAQASTEVYTDSDGDLYQCVRQADFAWAQGLKYGPDGWARDPLPRIFNRAKYGSPNTCFGSNEVEGTGDTIDTTLIVGGRQWQTLVAWSELHCRRFRYPANRDRILGHYQFSTRRSDPGPAFPWSDLIQDVRGALAEPWPRTRPYARPGTAAARRVALPPRGRPSAAPVAPDPTPSAAAPPAPVPVAALTPELVASLTPKQRQHVRAIKQHAEALLS